MKVEKRCVKKRFFTITFWSLAEPDYHQLCSCIKSYCRTSKPPKVPSRGHSSEQKKWRVTGAERFSSHLLQKSPRALGEAVKSGPRPFQGCWFLVFFFVQVWWRADFRRTCQVNHNMHWEILSPSKFRRSVRHRTKHRKWIALNSFSCDLLSEHIVYSVVLAVCRVASEERAFSQLHGETSTTQHTRKSELVNDRLRVKTGVLVFKQEKSKQNKTFFFFL